MGIRKRAENAEEPEKSRFMRLVRYGACSVLGYLCCFS